MKRRKIHKKSIFAQEEGQCYLCNMLGIYTYHHYTEEHHIFEGTANRRKSEEHGMKVNLCPAHHRGDINGNKQAVHHNSEMSDMLHRAGQAEFEKTHTREDFREEFGQSWL